VLAIAFLINPTEHSNGSLSLSQTGLTERIIEALGLHSLYSTKKDNPAKTTPLTKDANGIPAATPSSITQVSSVCFFI
jgi:hypothetical protein